MVRQARVMALWTFYQLERLQMLVTAPVAAPLA
jgi:hypothetical protein